MNNRQTISSESQNFWENHWAQLAKRQITLPAVQWRISLITKILRAFIHPNKNVIDFGSGPGNLIRILAGTFPECTFTGLEQSASAVSYANQQVYDMNNVCYYQADLVTEQKEKGIEKTADIAICTEVLEHIENEQLFLHNCCTYIKQDGLFLITVPGGPRTEYSKYVGHYRHYTENSLKKILAPYFFEISTYSYGFPFYNLYQILSLVMGKKLISGKEQNNSGLAFKAACALFKTLLSYNTLPMPFGWQIVAVAHLKKQ